MMVTQLLWHDYKYFPYEKTLARKEIAGVLNPENVFESASGFQITGRIDYGKVDRLVYTRGYLRNETEINTLQHHLEKSCTATGHQKKQTTRYSVHGLHEYKGKFNPQIVRGILNSLGVSVGQTVYDPFCGSGTSLVECAIGGLSAIGTDINPLAVFISNAKLASLKTPVKILAKAFNKLLRQIPAVAQIQTAEDSRIEYLSNWFAPSILGQLEAVRNAAIALPGETAQIALALISDLLRDYSDQEPTDLRIRRRTSPFPTLPLIKAVEQKFNRFLQNLESSQQITGILDSGFTEAFLHDNRKNETLPFDQRCDAAITSPPYATALPYIDTQRLSLIWLDLCSVKELRHLEAELTGSRELIGNHRTAWNIRLNANEDLLTPDALAVCQQLSKAVGPNDGFRRKAVPVLLYRYLVGMQQMFREVKKTLKPNAPFALVVGHNRTTLGGKAFDLDTPSFLKMLATDIGWMHEASIPLQAYQRYSAHKHNSVLLETLLLLRSPNGL